MQAVPAPKTSISCQIEDSILLAYFHKFGKIRFSQKNCDINTRLTLFSFLAARTSVIVITLSITLNSFHSRVRSKILCLVTPGRMSPFNGGVINSFSVINQSHTLSSTIYTHITTHNAIQFDSYFIIYSELIT